MGRRSGAGGWTCCPIGGGVSFSFQPLSVLDTPDGLDLGGLTVRAPVPPVLVVSTVSLTLHDVLLAPVARVLVAHKAVGKHAYV